jgi:hypothetical protein
MFSLLIDYTKWHYTYAILNIFRLAQEFIRFFLNLFSVTLFAKTLFLPVMSIPVDDIHEAEVSDVIASFLGGLLMRLLGAIFRLIFILLGLVLSGATLIFFVVVLGIWLLTPVVFVALLYYGIHNMISL